MSGKLVLDENWLRELLGDELYLSISPMDRDWETTPTPIEVAQVL